MIPALLGGTDPEHKKIPTSQQALSTTKLCSRARILQLSPPLKKLHTICGNKEKLPLHQDARLADVAEDALCLSPELCISTIQSDS